MEDTILLEEGDTLELVTGHVTTGKASRLASLYLNIKNGRSRERVRMCVRTLRFASEGKKGKPSPMFTREDATEDNGFPCLFKCFLDRDVYGRNVELVPGGFLENISFCIFYSPSSHMVSGRR